jgi:hypothetical protein
MSGISTSFENDIDDAPISYRSHTIVILSKKVVEVMFPCTAQKLGIHSCGVLLSYMWHAKKIIFCPYSFFCLAKMLNSSDPPSAPLFLDLASDIGSLLVVRLLVELLLESKTYVVSKGISSVVAVNSPTNAYVAYLS